MHDEAQLIFRTVHGSRLYGLHHADSDYDRFEVYGWLKSRGKQKMFKLEDVTKTSFDRFMRYADKGVPQYLEAMFSEQADWDKIPYIRENYVPNMTNVREVYFRTIKAFWMRGETEQSLKMRRHALRLMWNLRDMMEHGRFNPTLTPEQAVEITAQAQALETLPDIL